MENKTSLILNCLFCSSTDFVLSSKDYSPKSGDQIIFANCVNSNDYDSLVRVAKNKAYDWAEKQAQDLINNFSKEMERLFR
jgi:hypothetical protein